MQYGKVIAGIFSSRPNRFVAQVEICGRIETVHVKNTGRCRELLIPGCTVYLAESSNPLRKTRYDLVAVEKKCPDGRTLLINMDSQMPNEAVNEWLMSSPLCSPGAVIRREVKYHDSRFDFMIEDISRRIFAEVKGVTLEKDACALFPDAPTVRGVRHLNELVQAVREGFEAWVIFVIQMQGVQSFRPNDAMHAEFGSALRRAAGQGVQILAVDSLVTPEGMTVGNPVPVIL